MEERFVIDGVNSHSGEAALSDGDGLESALWPPARVAPTKAPRPRIAAPGRLLLVALSLGAAYDSLVFQHTPGLGFTLFVLFAVAGLFLLSAQEPEFRPKWRNALPLGCATLFFAAMTSLRANGLVTFMNVAATLGLAALLIRFFAAGSLAELRIGETLGAPFVAIGHALVDAGPLVADVQAGLPDRRRLGARLMPALRGVLLAVPLAIIFTALLSSADGVFADGVTRALRFVFPADIAERLTHVLIAVCAAWLCAGSLHYAIARQAASRGAGAGSRGRLGFTEAMTVLSLVALIFLAFVAVQFAYLFGGSHRVLSVPGLTYAEYARQGFAELVWVAVLTLTMLVILRGVTRRDAPKQETLFSAMGSLLVGLTLVILASAAQRMSLYEAAYGATEMRLIVDDFIAFLGLSLLWMTAMLWRCRPAPTFAIGALTCLIGFGATVDLQNPEAAAAQTNLVRCQAGRDDASRYFSRRMSEDAALVLCRAFPETTGKTREAIGATLRHVLSDLETAQTRDSCQSWNFAKVRAYRELKAMEGLLPRR